LTGSNGAAAGARIDLLEARAQAHECDLVVKGLVNGAASGMLYDPASGLFTGGLSDPNLRAMAQTAGGELTFTCVPPGNGLRIAQEH
jgi:hypothetical protein